MDSARRGDIMINGTKIVSVGTSSDIQDKRMEIVEGRGKTLVMPGFVNGHTHAAMVLLRGLGEELPLKKWLEERIWPVEATLKPEHVFWGTMGAIMEMASTGTTCFTDMYFEMDEVAEAARRSGMRCTISRGIVGEDHRKIEEGIELFRKWNGKGNILVQLAPHAPYTVPLETIKEISASAQGLGCGVHLHFLEAQWEAGFLREKFDLLPLSYLEKAGLFALDSTILAHCVWFPEEDIPGLKDSCITVAHNPSSNMKLGSGFAPVQAFLDGGVRVSLGTDGAASNNRLDMWGEMRLAALIHKGATGDPTSVTAKNVLKMATFNGAVAAGFRDLGLVREEWQADLILVDLDRPQYEGWDLENIPGFLVYAGSSRDIVGTMVAGSWVYRNGLSMGKEREKVRQEVSRCRRELTASGSGS